jgi:hypothetical protein
VIVELIGEVQAAHPGAVAVAEEADEHERLLRGLRGIRTQPLNVRVLRAIGGVIRHCVLPSVTHRWRAIGAADRKNLHRPRRPKINAPKTSMLAYQAASTQSTAHTARAVGADDIRAAC